MLAAEKIILPLVLAVKSPMEREHFIGIVARAIGSTPDAVRASMPRQTKEMSPVTRTTHAPLENQSAGLTPVDARGAYLRAVALNFKDSEIAKRLETEYSRITGMPLPGDLPPERVLFEAGLAFDETPSKEAIDELIQTFELAFITAELAKASAALRQAEIAKDPEALEAATKLLNELSAKKSKIVS